MPDSAAIFISYRRADAAGHAKLLHDRLAQWFDADQLFYDRASIDAGQELPQRLADAVASAAVVLVLIGPDWLGKLNERAARAEHDFVRHEIELALARRGEAARPAVIPVLLGEANAPSPADLHAELREPMAPLLALDMHELRGKDADWEKQFERLRALLARTPGVPEPHWRAPARAPQPFPKTLAKQRLSACFQDPLDRLGSLRRALCERGHRAVVAEVALYGMGGVGKTQLALQYVFRYRDHYAGVWWFDVETADGLQLAASACCEAVGAALAGTDEPSHTLNAWLRRQEAPWLLVYDNAESLGTVRASLPDAGPHHVLITSRDPVWGGMATVHAEAWSAEQGANFLQLRLKDCGLAGDRDESLALAQALGGLPLALEQAAAYLEETAMPMAEYTVLVRDATHGPALLEQGRAATGYERSVMATLSIAFERLGAAAQQLLRLLAWCAPEPIAERVFRKGHAQLDPVLAEAARNPLQWAEAAKQLRGYGLAQHLPIPRLATVADSTAETAAVTEQALQLHRLTQDVVRHKLSDRQRDVGTVLRLLRGALPVSAHLPESWTLYSHLMPHVRAVDERLTALTEVDFESHAFLLDRIAEYLRVGPALYQVARQIQERILDASFEVQGAEHPDTLMSMHNLARTLADQGNLASAVVLEQRVLETRRRVLGREHPGVVMSMKNLSGTLCRMGSQRRARTLLKQALKIELRELGAEHPDTLMSLSNLASILAQQGGLLAAQRIEEWVLEVKLRVLDELDPNVLMSMNNLAGMLAQQGDLASAQKLVERALEGQRRVLGEEHPETLRSMRNLAILRRDQGDLPGAQALEDQALELERRRGTR